MKDITRRNFLQVSAATGAVAALAGCTSSDDSAAGSDAASAVASAGLPNAADYPIDPDGDDVEALWTSEEMRDGWTKVTNPDDGATLGVMDTGKIIQVSGLAFKDLNGNGKLDFYEDWRQDDEERAASLASELSAEDCIKLMWHGAVSDSSEDAEDADYGLIAKGSCAGVSRLGSDADSYASDIEWINTVQQKCEERDYGIPYLNSTDPYMTLGIPTTIALGAAMDKDLWRKAAMWTSRVWRATGVRCELGPQIDLYTQPTVARLCGAETEDPALGRDFTQAFGGGMQSTWGDDEATDDLGWGDESVGIMLKHFVGAGAIENGCNDHGDTGKYDAFPGDNYHAHLIPFLDGGMNLDSKTEQMAAVMPNYGIAYSEDEEYGPLYGGGFNKKQLSILRNAGWDGMICTDWGIISSGRGTEDMTETERYKLMIDASVDQYGGGFYPDTYGTEAYALLEEELGEDEALARVQESARRIFRFMMHVDLFEQPYSDRSVAKELFESEDAAAFASDANDKCVTMLKNAGGVISSAGIGDKPKVYIPQMFAEGESNFWAGTSEPATISLCFDEDLAAEYFDVVTDTVGDPSGDADDDGNATYVEGDITRATADELADVAYAIIEIQNPQDAYTGSEEDEDGNVTYKPITLQYREYTADSDAVTQTSVAGDTLEDGSKENRAHYGESTYATNESSLDLVIDTKGKLPEDAKLILIVNADHPMCFHEIEPYADVILLGWTDDGGNNLQDSAYAHIIAGEAEPYGLLQFQMPLDMDEVEAQLCDTPRDMTCYTDSEGNTYEFCFGLDWSGVIDDDRVATYKVSPLTTPETAVVADED